MQSKVDINPECSWDGLDIEFDFINPITEEEKEGIKKIVSDWYSKGVNEGYEDGYLHYMGSEHWDKDGKWYTVYFDMGTAGEEALDELEEKLSSYNNIDKIKVGYPTPEREMTPKEKEAWDLFMEIKKKHQQNS